MRASSILSAVLLMAASAGMAAQGESQRAFDRDSAKFVQVSVADPYLELRTGPGSGFPVVRVVPRGEKIQILFRRTDWYRVRDQQDKEGWARHADMQETLLASGEKLPLERIDRRDFDKQRWEAGMQTGNFGGGNVNSIYASYSLNGNLAAELSVAQTLSTADDSVMVLAGLTHTPRPDWRFAPFLELGTGFIRIEPQATIVEPASRTEQLAYYGVGARWYVGRRFLLRADYRSYVIFTKLSQNEDRNEWKAGFGFFF
jgi:hypothetical protein